MRFLRNLSHKSALLCKTTFFILWKNRSPIRVYALLCVFSGVLFFQCKDDEKSPAAPDEVEVTITASQTTVTLLAAAGSHEVKITSSGTNWKVKEDLSWLEATKVDNTILRVSYEKNKEGERSGKVIATIEDESIEITVTQSSTPVTLTTNSDSMNKNYNIPRKAAKAVQIDFGDALSFAQGITHWWVTGEGGSNDLPTGVTSVQFGESSRSSDISSKTFTMEVTKNATLSDRSLSLELHAATSNEGDSEGCASFTVTQAGNLVELSAVSLSIAATASSSASVDLSSALNFHNSVAQWWVTGAGGSGSNDLPTGVTSVQFGASARVSNRSVKAFTMEVTANPIAEARALDLELHVTTTENADSEGFVSFTVSQMTDKLVSVSSGMHIISASASTSAAVDLSENLIFNSSVAAWWITGQGGNGNDALPTGVTSVQYGAGSRSSDTSVKAFTMEVTANENVPPYGLLT